MNQVLAYIRKISPEQPGQKKGLSFKVAKIITPYLYLDVEEIDDNLTEFLENLLSKIYLISDMISEEYFK